MGGRKRSGGPPSSGVGSQFRVRGHNNSQGDTLYLEGLWVMGGKLLRGIHTFGAGLKGGAHLGGGGNRE